VVLLGAEEIQGRRPLDLGGMVEHLAEKFDFVTAGPDEDHIPRFRIERRAQNSEHLDEVIGEIAMGRSTLEG
jgi:hypothetical protein